MLVIAVGSVKEYNALTHQFFFSNKNVKRFKTPICMSRVKILF